jgi:hypothetical protein
MEKSEVAIESSALNILKPPILLLPKDYFRDYPDEKEMFKLDFRDVEWKKDFFIKADNIHECCEIEK